MSVWATGIPHQCLNKYVAAALAALSLTPSFCRTVHTNRTAFFYVFTVGHEQTVVDGSLSDVEYRLSLLKSC